MKPSDQSKGVAYDLYCGRCETEIVIDVPSQRLPRPSICPFCGTRKEFTITKIDTVPRR